ATVSRGDRARDRERRGRGRRPPPHRCHAGARTAPWTIMTFPGGEVELTTILVVSHVDRARDFWRDVVGAEVYREYGGSSCVRALPEAWRLVAPLARAD